MSTSLENYWCLGSNPLIGLKLHAYLASRRITFGSGSNTTSLCCPAPVPSTKNILGDHCFNQNTLTMATRFSGLMCGSVLVVGGCGFVGFQLVQQLLQQSHCGLITVLSHQPSKNIQHNVSYIEGDITDPKSISAILNQTNPEVIFHLAAPRAVDASNNPGIFHDVIVNGTRNLLDAAIEHSSIKVLIYTSTPAAYSGDEHFNVDETVPLWNEKSKTFAYYKAKAVADTMVTRANTPLSATGKGLLTASLRLPMVYGERDQQCIPGQLDTFKKGQTNIQLGDGSNMVEPVYAGNAATAHLLAAKALLASQTKSFSPRVDGEGHNITDGDPQPFWEFSRRIWRLVGDQTSSKEITVISRGIALGLCSVVEWAFFLLTLGLKKPPLLTMSRVYIQYSVYNATYNMEKAKQRLGYRPAVDLENNLKRSIAWEPEHHPEKYEGVKLVV